MTFLLAAQLAFKRCASFRVSSLSERFPASTPYPELSMADNCLPYTKNLLQYSNVRVFFARVATKNVLIDQLRAGSILPAFLSFAESRC